MRFPARLQFELKCIYARWLQDIVEWERWSLSCCVFLISVLVVSHWSLIVVTCFGCAHAELVILPQRYAFLKQLSSYSLRTIRNYKGFESELVLCLYTIIMRQKMNLLINIIKCKTSAPLMRYIDFGNVWSFIAWCTHWTVASTSFKFRACGESEAVCSCRCSCSNAFHGDFTVKLISMRLYNISGLLNWFFIIFSTSLENSFVKMPENGTKFLIKIQHFIKNIKIVPLTDAH